MPGAVANAGLCTAVLPLKELAGKPYTIAMVLNEEPQLLQGLEFEIVGADLSTEILEKAREGIYTQFERSTQNIR
mgnify:CR=1 FL=1